MSSPAAPARGLSPWWRHATVLVMIAGFSVLSVVTFLTYSNAPPIPGRVTDQEGTTLYDRAAILRGQEVFLKYGLMEHGTLWGHGAYLGPDFSAEYLHRLAEICIDATVAEGTADRDAAAARVGRMLKENRYDLAGDKLELTPCEATAVTIQTGEWENYFRGPQPAPGAAPNMIKSADEVADLTRYFAWAAWATVANRPGKDYSYTNNWPYEPLVGNHPTSSTYLWSALSLVTLLGGIGAILFAFGKFDFLGWGGEKSPAHYHDSAFSGWRLTPSQWATGCYFLVVAALFLLQALAGGALAHYRVEPGAFYGFDLAALLPYHLLRTWHLQLAVFWIATAWVGGGLFLAPLVGRAEPKGQLLGVRILFAALVAVVLGSLLGEWLGINNRLGDLWFWIGHQGSEYLDLGRLWQVLLAVGLLLWLFLMFRALRPAMRVPERSEMASLFLYSAVAIPVFYLPALFYGPHTNFAVIDNWRFWIIHLWVEGFFELFATVLVATMFHQMGLVSLNTATRVIYLDAILYLGAGIIGTGHHWYFTGQGTLNMGLAASFSAMEVVPLTLLTLDAWDFVRIKDRPCGDCGGKFAGGQIWAIYFLMAVGFWNFVGAGVFGFLINTPIVSYFEVGTLLTSNHGHTAMFGVFGMLALAVLVFCLRAMQSDAVWAGTERLVRFGFWGLNVGLALMVVTDLFPGGVLQLLDVFKHGYWHARRLDFLSSGTFHTLEWIRVGADTVFLVFGVVPILMAALRSFAKRDAVRAGA
ncbi:MAG TPA: cbb3-type cytochrome c oxidase subunit I [Candidatus Polarisedimenticolia bacterium]|nr:cbb3-type cytochrome c oxidase subunit I [Candidatus Polarisedimenticolia bacterium]